jgi:hypothetical protein
MKDSTEDQVRVHRALLHRRALVERVLPLGAPPLTGTGTTPHDIAPNKRQHSQGALLDRLGPAGRGSLSADVACEDRSAFGEHRTPRRDLERSSWMRYLMNVHLMWVD